MHSSREPSCQSSCLSIQQRRRRKSRLLDRNLCLKQHCAHVLIYPFSQVTQQRVKKKQKRPLETQFMHSMLFFTQSSYQHCKIRADICEWLDHGYLCTFRLGQLAVGQFPNFQAAEETTLVDDIHGTERLSGIFLFLSSDLKKLYFQCGVENKPTVFLFNDIQVVEEGFLEDINNILSSGEVPNLYKPDEFEEVCTIIIIIITIVIAHIIINVIIVIVNSNILTTSLAVAWYPSHHEPDGLVISSLFKSHNH